MVGLGLAAPLATQLLAHAGLAQSPTPVEYKPTRAGGGGALGTLFWQAPTLLNSHFAVGAKDAEGAQIFYEPLAGWDPDDTALFVALELRMKWNFRMGSLDAAPKQARSSGSQV
jgi:peptide/nickel transport system substrate-binding protein